MTDTVPSKSRFDVYGTVTEKIIRAIETGVDPFTMPWHGLGGKISRPVNAATKAAYRGVNVVAFTRTPAPVWVHNNALKLVDVAPVPWVVKS